MLKDITLGQYFPAESFVHSLDPRTKILFVILYMAAVFIVDSIYMFLPVLAFVVVCALLSKIPFEYMLRSLKPLRLILIFMFVINLFVTTGGSPIVDFWIIRITDTALLRAVFISVRLVLLVTGTSLLMFTTTPLSLTDGLETLLSPLKKVHFPAHELSMMMTIALRFIPTLLDETDRIMKAQLSRGADFETGNMLKRAKAMIPILIPLFISAFRRADELALAMESRCYNGGEGRTRMHDLKFGKNDIFFMLASLALLALVIVVK